MVAPEGSLERQSNDKINLFDSYDAAAILHTSVSTGETCRFLETTTPRTTVTGDRATQQSLLLIIDLLKKAQLDQAWHQHNGQGWESHTFADQRHGLASHHMAIHAQASPA